jgi:hypothetical protein
MEAINVYNLPQFADGKNYMIICISYISLVANSKLEIQKSKVIKENV